jgi:hypothetical protein
LFPGSEPFGALDSLILLPNAIIPKFAHPKGGYEADIQRAALHCLGSLASVPVSEPLKSQASAKNKRKKK